MSTELAQNGHLCPHCGSETQNAREDGYHLGFCGTEWFTAVGDVSVHLEPTIACKTIADLRARLDGKHREGTK